MRYCEQCGNQLSEDSRYCAGCGTPVTQPARMHAQPPDLPLARPALPGGGDSSIKVFLEDQQLSFIVPAQTIGGRVIVPMRPIFDAMGATLDWDAPTQTAAAVKGATTVITRIGNTTATINETAQTLDVPPTAINGSTLASLRFVAEAFGYHVKWDGASQTAYISAAEFPADDVILSPDYYIPNDITENIDRK